MRWLEEIRVRTQPRKEKEALALLREAAASVTRDRQLKSTRIYSHHSAPVGFSLILFWDTASPPTQGSGAAMLILEGLKALGLVDHTVLVEQGRSEPIKEQRGDIGRHVRTYPRHRLGGTRA